MLPSKTPRLRSPKAAKLAVVKPEADPVPDAVAQPEEQAFCWFSLAFSSMKTDHKGRAQISFANHYIGRVGNTVTLADIEQAKAGCGMDRTAVLIGVSNLGYMTRSEFTNNVVINEDGRG